MNDGVEGVFGGGGLFDFRGREHFYNEDNDCFVGETLVEII